MDSSNRTNFTNVQITIQAARTSQRIAYSAITEWWGWLTWMPERIRLSSSSSNNTRAPYNMQPSSLVPVGRDVIITMNASRCETEAIALLLFNRKCSSASVCIREHVSYFDLLGRHVYTFLMFLCTRILFPIRIRYRYYLRIIPTNHPTTVYFTNVFVVNVGSLPVT